MLNLSALWPSVLAFATIAGKAIVVFIVCRIAMNIILKVFDNLFTKINLDSGIKGFARSAIKIIYFLMAADGEIYHGEEEKFDLIGMELDPDFSNSKEKIIQECQAALNKVIDPEDYYDALQDGAEEALLSSQKTEGASISPKHLVWNLLSVAYSDEKYNDAERKFLKYVVRKLNIDKAVFLEMESSMLTLMDIERELAWIKTTNRPYLTIESMVNELADRKNVIFESVLDLIAL